MSCLSWISPAVLYWFFFSRFLARLVERKCYSYNRKTRSYHCSRQLFIQGHRSRNLSIAVSKQQWELTTLDWRQTHNTGHRNRDLIHKVGKLYWCTTITWSTCDTESRYLAELNSIFYSTVLKHAAVWICWDFCHSDRLSELIRIFLKLVWLPDFFFTIFPQWVRFSEVSPTDFKRNRNDFIKSRFGLILQMASLSECHNSLYPLINGVNSLLVSSNQWLIDRAK